MDFSQVIARADNDLLEFFLGKSAVRLLNSLDPVLATPTRLREILMNSRSEADLLRKKTDLDSIIDLLRADEVSELCATLGYSGKENPYLFLKQLKFTKDSPKETLLFDFFAVAAPELDALNSKRPVEPAHACRSAWPFQLDVIDRFFELLETGATRAVIHMPTGSGKTRTAIQIIVRLLQSNPGRSIVWLAHSEELCEQAASEFEEAWKFQGDREISVQRFWDTYNHNGQFISEGFIVAGLKKMVSLAKKNPVALAALADSSTLVVMDEAHQAIAPTYKLILDVLAKNSESRILGLTATPGRTWNDPVKDAELSNFFHMNKVSLRVEGHENPLEFLIGNGFLAKPDFQTLGIDSPNGLTASEMLELQNALDVPKSVLQKLGDDDLRNLKIVVKLEELSKRHERILFFASTVEHANLVSAILKAKGLESYSVTGKTDVFERQRVLARYKSGSKGTIILSNFGVLTTGFDAPRTSCVVIARPTMSLVLYSQMVGRGLRGTRGGGNEFAEIVTVVDSNLPGFGNISEAFMNWEDVW